MRILYRGSLDSCNYACAYCPFAKNEASREAHVRDRREVERFVEHVRGDARITGIFFTPWGEALTHRWYQRAIAELSNLDHVEKVAIQTNLSVRPAWLDDAKPERVGIWATFHPTQIARDAFVQRALEYHARGVSISVGIVGLPEQLEHAEALRAELPREIYVWVNAAKTTHGAYDTHLKQAFERVDPLFAINAQYHPSLGRACDAGHTVISVDGNGDARRCHFVQQHIGNLYDGTLALKPRNCPNQTCGCHIGYVHMPHLNLQKRFGAGLLERALPVYSQVGS